MKIQYKDIKNFLVQMYGEDLEYISMLNNDLSPCHVKEEIDLNNAHKFAFYFAEEPVLKIRKQMDKTKEVISIDGLTCVRSEVTFSNETKNWHETGTFVDCTKQWVKFLQENNHEVLHDLLKNKRINFKMLAQCDTYDWDKYNEHEKLIKQLSQNEKTY